MKLHIIPFIVIIFKSLYVLGQQTVFPADAGWVNVKTKYGAKGDGITDDTQAIRQALLDKDNIYQGFIFPTVLFFPKGTYLVSDTLLYKNDFYSCCVTLQGEDKNQTIIKLKDNAAGYSNPEIPKPVIFTRNWGQSFRQNILNLTVNTGNGNPGAVAIDYVTNNLGSIKNVLIKSGDGFGFCGLQMERGWPGPGMIKDVEVSGFDFGIRIGTPEYSMTFEDIILKNQKKIAFKNGGNIVSIRNLTSVNTIPVFENNYGLVVLIDANFSGSTSNNSAIMTDNGSFYLRNIKVSGYNSTMLNSFTNKVIIPEMNVTEFSNMTKYSVSNSPGLSLNLPVEETPEYFDNDLTNWANVKNYGNDAGCGDDAPTIQKALNSGKPIIYFPIGLYKLETDVFIPATVRKIIGFDGSNMFKQCGNSNKGHFVITEASNNPLIFERLHSLSVINRSSRSVAIVNSLLDKYDNTVESKLFFEDVVGDLNPSGKLNFWARQFNPELQGISQTQLTNNGGRYWVLGLKTEGKAVLSRTNSGGFTEILGGLNYPAQSFMPDDNTTPAFYSEDGCFSSIIGFSAYVSNGIHPVWVEEKANGTTKKILTSQTTSRYLFAKSSCSFVSSIAEEEKGEVMEVFPIPASELLNIKFPKGFNNQGLNINLTDIMSRQIISFVLKPGQDAFKLDLEQYSNGLYFLNASNEKQKASVKFILNK